MNNVNPMPNIAMVPGPPVGPAMPMMNNGAVAPPPGPRPQQPSENNKHLLNTYIYEYFLRNDMFDCARALLNADPGMKIQDGPNTRRDADGNIIANGDSMDVDNKDGIDSKGAEGLPQPSIPNPSMDNPFLYEWFCLFWDMFNAQKGKSGNPQVSSYMSHTQNQSRMRQNAQQEMLRNMRPDMTPQQQQQQLNMMRMQNGGMNMAMKNPNNMAQRAMANNQQNPQMMHMLQQQQQQKQGQMQRDPSEMDGNRARPSSPGSAENAPSPSKRMRLENGAPFNPGQVGMMPNGRPAGQGMPGQQVGPDPSALLQQQTVQLLHQYGIDPNALNREQFATLQAQSPAVQQKTIATYAQNLQQQQQQQMPKPGMPNANPSGPPGQGSPMVPQGPDGTSINTFYNASEMAGPGAIRPAGGPNGGQAAGGSNHALQDYQMQLMLLEQQNKKRLMMARQEQDGNSIPRDGGPGGPGGPGAPPGTAPPFQGTSPQGARPGASPNPADMKRGPHQMNPAGMGSPMAEGAQSRGSPNAMFMGNQMDPSQAAQFNMNGMPAGGMAGGPQMNGLRPPSSHPGQPPFTGPLNPQQQQQMMAARQGQMAGQPGQQMQWQQGGPGGPNGNQMGPQGQTPQPIQGTPQQRNAMPPPAQPAAAAGVNARNTSSPQVTNTAPPTPSQQNKAAPKKKDTKNAKDKRAATQKKSNPSLNSGATPVAEPAADAEATPATPITPVNPQQNLNRPGQNAGPNQAMPNGQAPAPVPQQTAPSMVPQPDPNQNQAFNMDSMADFGSLDFANPLASNDVLNDFDFDSFLHDNEGADGGFDFSNTGAFMDADGIET